MADKLTRRKLYVFFVILAIVILVMTLSANSVFEGIEPSRQLDVASILNDSTISPPTKVNMIKQIGISDRRYTTILNDNRLKDAQKVDNLRRIFT